MKLITVLTVIFMVFVFTISPTLAIDLDAYNDYFDDKVLKPCEGENTSSCIAPIKDEASKIVDFAKGTTKAVKLAYKSHSVGVREVEVLIINGEKIGRAEILVQSKSIGTLFEGDEILVDSDNNGDTDLLIELKSIDHDVYTVKLRITDVNEYEFSINKDLSSTNSRSVTLFINVSNAVEMKVSNSGRLEEEEFIAYQNTLPWVLRDVEGEKTVYVMVKTNMGNFVYLNDYIIYDKAGKDSMMVSNYEGKLVKDINSSSIYLVIGGVKKPIVSAKAFESYGYNWDDVIEADISVIPVGSELSGKPSPRKLVKGSSEKVYYLSPSGAKRLIISDLVFYALNYSWQDVITISDVQLAAYPDGDDIFSTSKHPDGTLVKYQNRSAVYLIVDGKKQWIASEQAFNEQGFDWGDIIEIVPTEIYEDTGLIEVTPPPVVADEENEVVFTLNLTIGTKNNEVVKLQDLLKSLGYFPLSIESTGYYGSITAKAVKAFQQASGFDPVGYVGSKTRDALNNQ